MTDIDKQIDLKKTIRQNDKFNEGTNPFPIDVPDSNKAFKQEAPKRQTEKAPNPFENLNFSAKKVDGVKKNPMKQAFSAQKKEPIKRDACPFK